MALFAIGDTHLSLGADKSMEVFRGWENYVERLEKNWRAVVSDEDTVVIDGDISWGMHLDDCEKDFAFLHALPGRKLLIKGNHDYWWETRRKIDRFLEEHRFTSMQVVFNDAVRVGDLTVCGSRGWFFDDESADTLKVLNRERQRLIRSIESAQSGTTPVVFLHYPPVMDGRRCEEIFSVLTEYGIRRCYFGHIHGDTTGRYDDFTEDGVRFSLIAADRLKFCPKLVSRDLDFVQ